MAIESDIGYCDSTVNATSGCDGCELWIQGRADAGEKQACYAGNYHQNRLAHAHPTLYAPKFNQVRMIPGRTAKAAAYSDLTGTERSDKPWLNGLPRIIFIGDMGDVLSRAVPFEYLRTEIIETVRSPAGRRHIWLLLTKQSKRLRQFAWWLQTRFTIPAEQRDPDHPLYFWPKNLWCGVTVTSQETTWRIEDLLALNGPTVKWVSIAPMRGDINLQRVPCRIGFIDALDGRDHDGSLEGGMYHKSDSAVQSLSWVTLEGESGDGECDIRAMSRVLKQCQDANVPAFVKQLGSHPFSMDEVRAGLCDMSADPVDIAAWMKSCEQQLKLKDRAGRDWAEWSESLRVRQMPQVIR